LKVLLLDLDRLKSKRNLFPNLALMKLSAHHKARGDTVLPLNFMLGGAEHALSGHAMPWIVYASCVFQENADVLHTLPLDGVQHALRGDASGEPLSGHAMVWRLGVRQLGGRVGPGGGARLPRLHALSM